MSPIAKISTPDLWLASETTVRHRRLRRETTLPPVVVPLHQTSTRFDHLDLTYYRATMADADFNFFVNFAGEDTLGFTDNDLEVFYPPED